MESGDLNRVSSMRRNTSSIWSAPRGHDELALKWDSLEKLPTYSRMRKGLFTGEESNATEIEIQKLGLQEKKQLLDRLVRDPEEDNDKFLLKIKNRIDHVAMDIPTVEVRFEHLNIDAEANLAHRALPTILNFSINMIVGLLGHLHIFRPEKRTFSILRDISGIIKPSRMTLLIGTPSSGKTTLLMALAGKLNSDLRASGRITYNGHGMDEFVAQRTSAYISPRDVHIPEMTVRETLAFSARCQGVGTGYEMLAELLRREKAANIKPDPDIDIFMKAAVTKGQEANIVTDYILKILGLDECADTLVGDEMLRGISGGQRKRVTAGEMLVGPAKTLFVDEISSGLDSSTTYQIVKALRESTHILQGTTVINLRQPAPEIYDLFDDIVLLSDGQIVYQGPCEHVLGFFESMGFKCPRSKGVPEFLQEVTTKRDQMQYWARKDEPYDFVTVKEFAEAFHLSHVGYKLGDELAIPFDKTKSHPAALATNKYGVTKMELLKACISREYLLMKRNSISYIFMSTQILITAFITMTLFLRTKMRHDNLLDTALYTGALNATASIVMFYRISELNKTIDKLHVFYKQRDCLFYPAWAYTLPTWILTIPVTFIEIGIWVFTGYYVIGYDPSVQRLLRQFLLLVFLHQVTSGLFRFTAALGRNMFVANIIGMFSLLAIMVSGGYILSRENVKKWWTWAYWVSPLMYAMNALAVNEFLGHRWRHILPPFTEPVGVMVIKSRGYFPAAYWYWIGLGALFGYMFLFNGLFTLALAYLNPLGKHHAVLPEEAITQQSVNITREAIEMSSQRDKTTISILSRSTNTSKAIEAVHSKKSGMVLPFQPLYITFINITYSIDMPQEMKSHGTTEDRLELLKGVSGAFRPGVLTALMGVSGAGKTTLMDVLAGRKTGGYINGRIYISGYPKQQETFARISGYCEQNDTHSPHITVYESLVYSSWLRLPLEVDSATRMRYVEEIMELVQLSPLREAIVGLPGTNGLSAEQRKRLTIAVELVANPSIIFMDEPTSGLDARDAAMVMKTVRSTVDTGRTVVCTIHHPNIEIFEAFDELFLLKQGGQEIYVGPLGPNSCHLINYFEGVEGVSKIKDSYNPATWVMEVTDGLQEKILKVDFADVYNKSELCGRNKVLIKELSTPPSGSTDLHFSTEYSQSFFTQCMACLWKQYMSYWRNPSYNAVRFFSTTILSLMMGSMFWDLGSKRGQKDLINAMGSMYAAVLFLGIQNATSVQPVVAIERTVSYRERAARMYSSLPYAFGQLMIEIPYIFVQTMIYGIIVYTMIGFEWTAAKFFWCIFFMYFTLLYFTFYGMMAVAISPNQQIGATASSAFYVIWNIFSGFVIPRTRIPIWWRWYYWACPVAWTLYGLLVSQYGDSNEQLETGGQVKDFVRSYFGFKHDFLPIVSAAIVGSLCSLASYLRLQ